jgi:hypothetical protein
MLKLEYFTIRTISSHYLVHGVFQEMEVGKVGECWGGIVTVNV